MNLTSLVAEWIKDHPRFKDHFAVAGNDIGGIKMDWIHCKCKKPNEYPPLPNHDILIAFNEIAICVYNGKQRKWNEVPLSPFDKELFTKLEFALDHSHELPSY